MSLSAYKRSNVWMYLCSLWRHLFRNWMLVWRVHLTSLIRWRSFHNASSLANSLRDGSKWLTTLWKILAPGTKTCFWELSNWLSILRSLLHPNPCGSLVCSTLCLTWLPLSSSLLVQKVWLWMIWASRPLSPTGSQRKRYQKLQEKVPTSMDSPSKELPGRRVVEPKKVTLWIWSLRSLLHHFLSCLLQPFLRVTFPSLMVVNSYLATISAQLMSHLLEDPPTMWPPSTWRWSPMRLTQEDGLLPDAPLSCNPSDQNSDYSQTISSINF